MEGDNTNSQKEITELRKLVNELNCKLLDMELSNKRKLEFISHLSHEFKTPLNAIQGYTSLMYEKELPREKQVKYYKNILCASKHLFQIMEYTIEMARAETDKITLCYEKFNPTDIIKEVLSVLEERMKEKKISLNTDLTDILITADKRRFRQLIYNLAGNATKFNYLNGIINIKTTCAGENFYFEIKDTGRGIALSEQNKVFEFFTHLDSQNFDNEEGSGIGLSLCKKIINLHGGEIGFNSEPEKCTFFWFSLPLKSKVSDNYSLKI